MLALKGRSNWGENRKFIIKFVSKNLIKIEKSSYAKNNDESSNATVEINNA